MKFNLAGSILLIVIMILGMASCRKKFDATQAFAVVDKISLNYGNDRVYNSFTILNSGEETLNYHVDEQIDWLEISNADGNLAGRSEIELTCKVNRTGLPQQNYYGELQISSNGGDYVIGVYMMVEMYLVTFINPVFTTIVLDMGIAQAPGDTSFFRRNIGKNDSTQFGFLTSPEAISYYAQTSGRYTDSTQLGLLMEWEGFETLSPEVMPRLSLNVSKAYFHFSIINNFQVLNPLYVNAGTQYEIIENVFVYQSSDPLPVGYYHAFSNTQIRAYRAGGTSAITWSNGTHFTLPFTDNQSATIDSYNGDSLKKKSQPIPNHHDLNELSKTVRYDNLIQVFNKDVTPNN